MSLPDILRRTRTAILRKVSDLGAGALVAGSAWRRQRLLILCYHGVSVRDEHEWATLYVSQEHLARRLERLRALGANVIPLDEALARLRLGDLPNRAVSITFDDGAADFCTRAYPVLAAHAAPATLYQTTWHVDRPYPVYDNMSSYLMWQGRERSVRLPWLDREVVIPTSTLHPDFVALHGTGRRYVLEAKLDGDEQMELLQRIADACRTSLDGPMAERLLWIMSSSELRSLDERLVDIQLHTHRHRTPSDRTLFLRELDDNASALARILDRPLALRHFCYPSGVHKAQFADWLRSWGVISATTCDTGIAAATHNSLFLPRFVDTMFTPDAMFDGWVTGIARFMTRGQG